MTLFLISLCLMAQLPYITMAGENLLAGVSPAIVQSGHVSAVIGVPVTISCSSDNSTALQSCRWARRQRLNNGDRYTVTVLDTPGAEHGPVVEHTNCNCCNCTYNYTGKGIDKGDCSISINTVTDFHIGEWDCVLVSLAPNNHTWLGSVNISRAPSTKPYFPDSTNPICIHFNESSPQSTEVTCCVDTNDPESTTLEIELAARTGTKNDILGTSAAGQRCITNKYTFIPEDNRKLLICAATFKHLQNNYTESTMLSVTVEFGPILDASNYTQETTEHNSLLINVTFMANPKPNVSWHLHNDPATGATFEIPLIHVKYRTELQHLRDDYYTAFLEVLHIEPADYGKQFLLQLKNDYGTRDVLVNLVNPNGSSESETGDKYWITVLLAIGTILCLIVVATIVFCAIQRRVHNRGRYIPAPTVSYSANA